MSRLFGFRSGLMWSAAETWGAQILNLLVMAALARLLGTHEFGVVSACQVLIVLINIFVRQGLGDALIQTKEITAEQVNCAFWLNVLIGAFFAGVGFFGADSISAFIGEPQIARPLRWLSLGFVISGATFVQEALLQRELNFRPLAVRRLLALGVGGGLSITIAINGGGVWSLVALSLVSQSISTVLLWRMNPWRPTFAFSITPLRSLVSYSISMMGLNLLSFLNTRADALLITKFMGVYVLGPYALAQRTTGAATDSLAGLIARVMLPSFSKQQEDPKLLGALYTKTLIYSNWVAVPAFVMIACYSNEISRVVFGGKWPELPVLLVVFSGIAFVNTIRYANAVLLKSVGHPFKLLVLNLLTTGLGFIVFFIQAPKGISNVASGWLLSLAATLPIGFWLVTQFVEIDWTALFKSACYQATAVLALLATKIVIGGGTGTFVGRLDVVALTATVNIAAFVGTAYLMDGNMRELARRVISKAGYVR